MRREVKRDLPNSPSDSDDWQKPTKMAHHRSPGACTGEPDGDAAMMGSGFAALGPLDEGMDLDLDEEPGLRDTFMADPTVLSLKRAQSPPKMPTSNSLRVSLTKVSSSSVVSTIDQVSSPSLCMAGDRVDRGRKGAALPNFAIKNLKLDLVVLVWNVFVIIFWPIRVFMQ